jgi:hypothetical protein
VPTSLCERKSVPFSLQVCCILCRGTPRQHGLFILEGEGSGSPRVGSRTLITTTAKWLTYFWSCQVADRDMVMVNWYCRGCFLIRRGGGSCRSPIASGRHWWWRSHRSLKWVSGSLHAEAGCSLICESRGRPGCLLSGPESFSSVALALHASYEVDVQS